MLRAVALGGIMLALAVHSPASAYVSDGHEYELSCNDNGYALVSKYPVSRMVGTGAASQFITERETLYLGRSCDAFHKIYREGTWCWANGGFKADFADRSFGFARQELSCEPKTEYDLNCRC